MAIWLTFFFLLNGIFTVSAAGGIRLKLFSDLQSFNDPKDTTQKPRPKFQTNARQCPTVDVAALERDGFLQSQTSEDKCLLRFFNGLCNGRYIEMGAIDGVTFSNTYAFHFGLEWKGVNIELVPRNYEKLKANRVHDIANINAAVCSEHQTVHYVDSDRDEVSGVWEFVTPAHRENFWRGIKFEDTIPIQCSPLQSLLDESMGAQNPFFDFFSLDIEGAELSALMSIDWDRTGFGILIIERNVVDEEKNRDVTSYLTSKGYDIMETKCGSSWRNLWFINKDVEQIYWIVNGEGRRGLR